MLPYNVCSRGTKTQVRILFMRFRYSSCLLSPVVISIDLSPAGNILATGSGDWQARICKPSSPLVQTWSLIALFQGAITLYNGFIIMFSYFPILCITTPLLQSYYSVNNTLCCVVCSPTFSHCAAFSSYSFSLTILYKSGRSRHVSLKN